MRVHWRIRVLLPVHPSGRAQEPAVPRERPALQGEGPSAHLPGGPGQRVALGGCTSVYMQIIKRFYSYTHKYIFIPIDRSIYILKPLPEGLEAVAEPVGVGVEERAVALSVAALQTYNMHQ